MENWVFDDDVAEIETSPAGLILALKRLHLEPRQTIYLGDSLTDVEAVQALGSRGLVDPDSPQGSWFLASAGLRSILPQTNLVVAPTLVVVERQ